MSTFIREANCKAILDCIPKETIEQEKPFRVSITFAGRRYLVYCPEIYTNPINGAWTRSAAAIVDKGPAL